MSGNAAEHHNSQGSKSGSPHISVRVGRGSVSGLLVLAADWDSDDTNARIADDFGTRA